MQKKYALTGEQLKAADLLAKFFVQNANLEEYQAERAALAALQHAENLSGGNLGPNTSAFVLAMHNLGLAAE